MTSRELFKRDDDSVQASLAELRDLELARLQAERIAEAERRKADEERAQVDEQRRREEKERAEERRRALIYEQDRQRLAAEHELELAKETARVDADARVRERALELDIKKAELAALEARAAGRSVRGWGPLLVIAALLLFAQGALLWAQRSSERELARDIAALQREARATTGAVSELETATGRASTGIDGLSARVMAIESTPTKAPSSASDRAEPAARAPRRTSAPTPRRQQSRTPGPIRLDPSCINNPLC